MKGTEFADRLYELYNQRQEGLNKIVELSPLSKHYLGAFFAERVKKMPRCLEAGNLEGFLDRYQEQTQQALCDTLEHDVYYREVMPL